MVACTGTFKSICHSNMILVCNAVFRCVSTTDRSIFPRIDPVLLLNVL